MLYATIALAGAFAGVACRRAQTPEPAMQVPEGVPAAKIDPWKEAALKIEEERGEDTGRKAEIEVPSQLKHYADRRRFLAVQVAEWRGQRFETPHDYAALVALVRRGDLVEAPALGADFILYGVGENASDEPFTHYDRATGKGVTLYATDAELEQEDAQLDEAVKGHEEAVAALAAELKLAPKRDRELRRKLTEESAERKREAAALRERRKLLESFYKNQQRRATLAAEYEELAALARDFGGRAYDLNDAAARKQLKVRLLSHVRPAALKVIEEVARAYREKFGRHLPVTSLVRTDEYQRRLSTVNPNATTIETAPHTTGLAFDVYYRYMTAAEQEFVMATLASLRDAGRVEALRERRDHYHVFAFLEGKPPDERLVRAELG
ncbi:MAG: DUF5715 family protein, partial [Acidobacteria bacterium]|nr:DUF5715 family protein [Acidobacteriota bacterium]